MESEFSLLRVEAGGGVSQTRRAGSGLGEATAKDLAAHGAKIIAADINLAAAERVAGEIGESN